jgi:hypothetical protein
MFEGRGGAEPSRHIGGCFPSLTLSVHVLYVFHTHTHTLREIESVKRGSCFIGNVFFYFRPFFWDIFVFLFDDESVGTEEEVEQDRRGSRA